MNDMPRIYLVDHDSSARRGLSNLLTSAGHNISVHTTLKDFLNLKKVEKRACIIIDANLPDMMEGTELQNAFTLKDIHIPILFLSAQNDRSSRKIAIDVNAKVFFQKPVDGMALLDAVAWEIERLEQQPQDNAQ